MNIRKLEQYKEDLLPYGDRVQKLLKNIQERQPDHILEEYIRQLAEACYKEGYKDGYRLAEWLNE